MNYKEKTPERREMDRQCIRLRNARDDLLATTEATVDKTSASSAEPLRMKANELIFSSRLFASIRGSFFVVVLIFSFAADRLSAFDWTIFKQNGRDYIPLTDLARFYDFNTAEFSNGVATLNCAAVHLQCASGSRDLYLNGLKFILNLPILDIQDRLCISRLDLAKLVDPVLRPAKISGSPVRTVVIDAGHGGADSGARGPLGKDRKST